MTKFNTAYFFKSGDTHFYKVGPLGTAHFIARFKYSRAGWGDFKKFLIANFTVEEYVALSTQNAPGMTRPLAPMEILETKGWVHPNMRRECRLGGYPETKAGFHLMMSNRRARESFLALAQQVSA